MSWFLYRLSRFSFRHRWAVISTWLTVLVAMGIAAATLSGPTTDSFTLKGLESTKAFELIEERAPSASAETATAQIVFQAPEGQQLSAYAAQINDDLGAIKTDQVRSIVSPFDSGAVSGDGRAGYATVTYTVDALDASDTTRESLLAVADDGSSTSPLVAVSSQILASNGPEGGSSELGSVLIAAVVLVFTLGTLLAAGMSLLTALVGVGIGVAGITAATGLMDIGSTTPLLALMLGLAVGIDYALFIFSRYRHELAIGQTPEEAAGRAVGTAGSAVVFAGVTVVVALVGLSIAQIRFLTEMGIAAAATVVIAVLIAITLLPAVFGVVKGRVVKSRIKFLQRFEDSEADTDTLSAGRRYALFITKHRIATFIIGLAAAVLLIIPAASLQLAVPDGATEPAGSQSRISYDLLSDNFGPGVNGPLLVVVDTIDVQDKAAAVAKVDAAVATIKDDVAAVVPAGPAADTAAAKDAFDQQLAATNFATITVIPNSGPSALETKNLVSDLRKEFKSTAAETGTTIYVSGQTAVGIDLSKKMFEAFPKYLVVVVGIAFILLMAVFRSVLVPLKAVVGFLLSIGIAIGVTVAIAQWGWLGSLVGIDRPAPVMFLLPLLLTGILFGLAMDYELFLVSRMREEYVHGKSAVDAIVEGFAHSSKVVTAAAIIMISVFGGFALIDMQIVKTIGIGLAVGLFADAFLVRMTLVPAFMAILGDRIWWLPKWLDRLLPNLDIEGEQLTKRLDAEPSK